MAGTNNVSVVLVHGGFVDGSGWEGVYNILKKDGYPVSIVQNPTLSLAGDVEATRRILAAQDGPAILVGQRLARQAVVVSRIAGVRGKQRILGQLELPAFGK